MRVGSLIFGCLTCLYLTVAAQAETPPVIKMGSKSPEVILTKITVSDLRASYDFYTQILGMKEIVWPGLPRPNIDDSATAFTEVMLNYSGSPADPFLGLVKQKDLIPAREQARMTWVGVKSSDARETVRRAKQAGFPVIMEPTVVLGFVAAVIGDPDGYSVEILEIQSVIAAR